MSIYRRPRDSVFADFNVHSIHSSPVPTGSPGSGARNMSEAQLRAHAALDEQEARKRSKAQPSDLLLPRTLTWAASLPKDVRPHELIRVFPRIANQLAADWTEPDAARAYFAQLLASRRVNRNGFPEQVESELLALHRYYAALHPNGSQPVYAWQDVRKR